MNLMLSRLLKVKVGNDQEMAQSERNSHYKTEVGKQSGTYTKKFWMVTFLAVHCMVYTCTLHNLSGLLESANGRTSPEEPSVS